MSGGRGAGDRPLTYAGEYDATRTYLARQVATHAGLVYMSVAKTTGHAPPNATYWLPLGGGGATAPTTSPMAAVGAPNQTAYAHQYTFIDFTLGSVSDIDTLFPLLGMVIDSGSLYYPPGEGIYDMQMTLRVTTTDLTDEGKLVGLAFKSNLAISGTDSGGWNAGGHQPLRRITSSPDYLRADLSFVWWDFLGPGNGTLDGQLVAGIDGRYMTVDADAVTIALTVLKRT